MSAEAHRGLRELVGAYALGQLTGEQWRAVHEHLEMCPVCRADLDEIAPVADLLSVVRDRMRPDEFAEPDPATDGYVPPLSPALLAQARGRSRWWSNRVPLAAAAAAVLVAAGVGFGVAAVAAPVAVPQEAVAVRTLAGGVRAQAGLVAHTWGMEVKLVATGFEPGRAYRVTVTDDSGRTVGAGEFIGTGAEEMRCNLNSSILRAAAATVRVTDPDGQVVLDALV